MNSRTKRLGSALTLVIATAALGFADNVTPATARSIAMNSTSQDSLQSGTRASVWYKVQMFAGRSYQISVWSVKEDGVFVNIEPVELFSDAAGTVLVSAGVTSTDTALEGSPNDGNLGPRTTIFQPTATGLYLIHAGTDTLALASTKVNVRVRETTLFSPWLSKAAGFEGFVELHNNTNAAVSVTLKAYDNAGTLQGAGLTFTIPANATVFQTGGLIGVPVGVAAGVVLTHNGAFGAISGNITTLNGANGLSFDSPFTPRDSGGAGGGDASASGANSDITSLTGLTTPLSVDQGGTGQSTLPTNGIVYGQGTAGVATTVGAAGQVLAGTAGAPLWTGSPSLSGDLTLVSPSTATTGNIMKGLNRFIHNFGTFNTFIGENAGNFVMSGANNTATGALALQSNTTGIGNTATGAAALQSNTSGGQNTATGVSALASNTIGIGNTATGQGALYANTSGSQNTANGAQALEFNTIGTNNTASGSQALFNNSTGINNTATGATALLSNTTGSDNTATGQGALSLNTTGSSSTATGRNALQNSTTAGFNTAYGANVLRATTTGNANTAIGFGALSANTTGGSNTAAGVNAMLSNTTGFFDTAVGISALVQNTTGAHNTAIGSSALSSNTTGSSNIALGEIAGSNLTTGSFNIHIGNLGLAGEDSTTRIGDSNQARTFISGIRFATTGANDAIAVMIDSNGQLGTVSSSRRFKDDIADMDAASTALMRLRPVTFHYKTDQDPLGRRLQYGLIAEEVADVYPGLVARAAGGQVETVLYQFLPPMLLNEYQKQQRRIEAQAAELVSLKRETTELRLQAAEMAALKEQVASMGELLKTLSQQSGMNRAAQIAGGQEQR